MHGRLGDFADSPSLDAATLLGTRDCDQAGATVGRTLMYAVIGAHALGVTNVVLLLRCTALGVTGRCTRE